MNNSNLLVMVLFLSGLFIGGIFGGVIYFSFHLLESNLQSIDFQIPLAKNSTTGAPNVTRFQDVLEMTIYPFFGIIDALPYLTYFMCFSFIIALAMVSYLSSKNPIFFILHILYTLLLSYFSIILSNTYQHLLTDSFFNNMMTDFTIYNLIMLYLPQIFFITSLVFGGISFVNVLKPSTAEHPYGLNYGGEF